MPVSESADIVARFLRANHYTETLEAFLKEAGLPDDCGSLGPGKWTIEQILQEKTQFDTSLKFEKRGNDGPLAWTQTAPTTPIVPEVSVSSNVLCVSGNSETNTLSVTTADRSWKDASGASPFNALSDGTHINDSPVLSINRLNRDFILSTSMSGHLALYRPSKHELIDQCRHHSKYAVQVISHLHQNVWVVATAGWDKKIMFYALEVEKLEAIARSSQAAELGSGLLDQPFHSQLLPSNPESIMFAEHPDNHDLYLIASRRDSTHLYYFKVEGTDGHALTVKEAGRQNLAPHSNAWVAFTPCSISACPTDPTLVAVATSHLPHMKLIIVRLLFPGNSADEFTIAERQTQASVARAELARQDREDAAIKLHVTTLAPQTPYSTPHVVWRPDGSGLFVNGDDGVIRGIEAISGKIVTLLKGHEVGSKVRTLWAGRLQVNETSEEVLISGGFDKKLLIWTVEVAG